MDIKIALLGTGTSTPSTNRMGPATALIVEDSVYLVDAGIGVVRQLNKLYEKGVSQLNPKNINKVFISHLHSDHFMGLSDLVLTPWLMGREEGLNIYGPSGIKNIGTSILDIYEEDINSRKMGMEQGNETGYKIDSFEIEKEGLFYEDELVKVEAIEVSHFPIKTYAYKFIVGEKILVFSSDTTPSPGLIEKAKGCDILVHEVVSSKELMGEERDDLIYYSSVHTPSIEMGKVAREIGPKKLILTHIEDFYREGKNLEKINEEMIKDIGKFYEGDIVVGEDLLVVEV